MNPKRKTRKRKVERTGRFQFEDPTQILRSAIEMLNRSRKKPFSNSVELVAITDSSHRHGLILDFKDRLPHPSSEGVRPEASIAIALANRFFAIPTLEFGGGDSGKSLKHRAIETGRKWHCVQVLFWVLARAYKDHRLILDAENQEFELKFIDEAIRAIADLPSRVRSTITMRDGIFSGPREVNAHRYSQLAADELCDAEPYLERALQNLERAKEERLAAIEENRTAYRKGKAGDYEAVVVFLVLADRLVAHLLPGTQASKQGKDRVAGRVLDFVLENPDEFGINGLLMRRRYSKDPEADVRGVLRSKKAQLRRKLKQGRASVLEAFLRADGFSWCPEIIDLLPEHDKS